MRVLVTGGAGFIGSHVSEALLQRGHDPFIVDNLSTGSRLNLVEEIPLFNIDICNGVELARVFDSVQPDWVCHHAAQISVSRSMRDPCFDAEVNVIGLLNVLENAARVGVRKVIFASSGGVLYGEVTSPANEVTPAQPISPYGISKWVGERYLEFYTRERGLRGVALRYSNVYGPRQNPSGEAGVIANFSRRMLAGEQTTINGDGRYVRDYLFVKDAARATVLALETELQQAFMPINIGTGRGLAVNEVAELIRSEVQIIWDSSGRTGIIPTCKFGIPRSGDVRSNVLLPDQATRILNWQPEVSLECGVRQTVEWFANTDYPSTAGESMQ